MDNSKYLDLFRKFRKAPMEEFMEHLIGSLPGEKKALLIVDDVAYHRVSPEEEWLCAWLYMKPFRNDESDRWISVDILHNARTGSVRESFSTLDFAPHASLEACIDFYLEGNPMVTGEELERKKEALRRYFADHRLKIHEIGHEVGPFMTVFKVFPVNIEKLDRLGFHGLTLYLCLGIKGVLGGILPLDQGIGVRIVNDRRSVVSLRGLLESDVFRASKASLPLAIGLSLQGEVEVVDLAVAPNILIAGAPAQGQAECIDSIVASLLLRKAPSDLRLVLMDSRGDAFRAFGDLPGYLWSVLPGSGHSGVITRPEDAAEVLGALCAEMEGRDQALKEESAGDIVDYNKRSGIPFPHIVCIVNEYADFTVPFANTRATAKRTTDSILRLAMNGKQVGIHLVLVTARPSREVITNLIKANFPTKIALRTTTRTDSLSIFDTPGAETLLRKGDMLLSRGFGEEERIQGGTADMEEIRALLDPSTAQG